MLRTYAALGALCLGLTIAGGSTAQAEPVEYVKICNLYGVGFYYIPGTDQCIRLGGSDARTGTSWSQLRGDVGIGVNISVGEMFALKLKTEFTNTDVGGSAYRFINDDRVPWLANLPFFGGKNGRFFIYGNLNGAWGAASKQGSVSGTSYDLGLTTLYDEFPSDPVNGTGLSIGPPHGDFEGSIKASNHWYSGGIGVGRVFEVGRGLQGEFRIGLYGEKFIQEYNLDGRLYYDNALAAKQCEEAWMRDHYGGIDATYSLTYRVNRTVSLTGSASIQPAIRVSEGYIKQFTACPLCVTGDFPYHQRVERSETDFTLSGGLGASVNFNLGANWALGVNYQHLWLGGITNVHFPENPDQQPAGFTSDTATNDVVRFRVTRNFWP